MHDSNRVTGFRHKLGTYTRTLRKRWRLASARRRHAHIMRHRGVSYSVALPQQVGFTDQILLLALLYKLGAMMRFRFHYTVQRPKPNLLSPGLGGELEAERTFAGGYRGIFEFLGIDWYFSRRKDCEPLPNGRTVDFHFDESTFENNRIVDLPALIAHLSSLVEASSVPGQGPLHIRFVLREQIRALVWLHDLPNSLLDFDLADIYRQFRQQYPVGEVFDKHKPRLLLHIRQGDTAVVETPWHTFIQVWPRGRDNFKERNCFADIADHQRISVADFERFYADLTRGLDAYAETSTVVHSDGFARAFFMLEQYRDRLALSDEQFDRLMQHGEHHDKTAFEVFERHRSAGVFVGEQMELLFELMQAFYTADVVIIGTQQRMLVKQYAYSFLDGGGPLLITLYRQHKPHYNYLGNRHLLDHCLYVDLENYCVTDTVRAVNTFLSTRYRAT